jgi:hypothetical protein
MNGRIPGERKCIGGKEYEYVPPENSAQSAGTTTTDASLSILDQIAGMLKGIASIFTFENTYTGAYRNIIDYTVKPTIQNDPIALGFPVRLFYLTTAYPITLRLGSTLGDKILLSSATSPFQLEDLSRGMSFDTIYVSNDSNSAITISIFAMG